MLRLEVGPALFRWRDLAQPVSEKTQLAVVRDGGVELPNRAGCGVARVHEQLFVLLPLGDLLALAFVELLELVAAHVDLAAHLQHRRRTFELQGNLPDGADARSHVFADFAVAARGGLNQTPVFIAQVHRQTVELQFADVDHGRRVGCQGEFLSNARIESDRAGCGDVGFGADRQHRHLVAHLGEAFECLAADALRGRIRRAQLGIRFFEFLKAPEQPVVLGVGQQRRIEHVIEMRMMAQLLGQGRDLVGG